MAQSDLSEPATNPQSRPLTIFLEPTPALLHGIGGGRLRLLLQDQGQLNRNDGSRRLLTWRISYTALSSQQSDFSFC
jgi:hypothetical protein